MRASLNRIFLAGIFLCCCFYPGHKRYQALPDIGMPHEGPPEGQIEAEFKNNFWSVSLTGERFTLKSDAQYELLGNSGGVAAGYGYIRGRWFLSGEGEFLVGPFDPGYRPTPNVDYQGTAFQIWWGYSAEEPNLRHPDGGYGFILGLNYKDIVGRSVDPDSNRDTPDTWFKMRERFNYSIRTGSLSVTPGIFFCWLKEPRSVRSKDLTTRIEGYLLTLSYSMPLYARYLSRYSEWEFKNSLLQRQDPEKTEDFRVPAEGIHAIRKKTGGKLKGHSIAIRFQALLGA